MRFPNKDKHNAAATHVHDFLVAEIDRLTEAEAGALVLSSLGCALLVMKLRLGRRDVLPPAKLITTVLQKCPGIPRCVLRVYRGNVFGCIESKCKCEGFSRDVPCIFDTGVQAIAIRVGRMSLLEVISVFRFRSCVVATNNTPQVSFLSRSSLNIC